MCCYNVMQRDGEVNGKLRRRDAREVLGMLEGKPDRWTDPLVVMETYASKDCMILYDASSS